MEIPKSNTELIKELNINVFELVSLLNNRVRELIHGAKPLIEDKNGNFMEIAIHELLSGKIKPHTSK